MPSEQVDENHVAAQQLDASEAQVNPHVVAEQTQTSEQVDESHVEVRQSGASENNDVLHVVAEQTQTSEQVDESHVAAQQSGASEAQDSHVVAEQTQTSEQVDESHVAAQQSDASEKNASYEEKPISHEKEFRRKIIDANSTNKNTTKEKQAAKDAKKLNSNKAADDFAKSKGYKNTHDLKKQNLKGERDTTMSHYNIYYNAKTKELFLKHESTGRFIKID